MHPSEFPRGLGEIPDGREKYLQWRIDFGDESVRKTLEQERKDGFSTLLFTPNEGVIYDVGIDYYGEFICSLKTGLRFLKNGMTLNGKKGTVQVVSRHMNGVQMRFYGA